MAQFPMPVFELSFLCINASDEAIFAFIEEDGDLGQVDALCIGLSCVDDGLSLAVILPQPQAGIGDGEQAGFMFDVAGFEIFVLAAHGGAGGVKEGDDHCACEQ